MEKNTRPIAERNKVPARPWKPNTRGIALIALVLILLEFSYSFALDVPKLQRHVNDYAQMISPATTHSIEEKLQGIEQSDTTQIVILTVPSLQGEPIEDYGIKVAEAWKIGQKGKDNGVIFLVSRDERKMRIEVGRGFEGKITDLTAGRIIDNVAKPKFKDKDYDGAFEATVDEIIKQIKGQFTRQEPQKDENWLPIILYAVAAILGAAILAYLANLFFPLLHTDEIPYGTARYYKDTPSEDISGTGQISTRITPNSYYSYGRPQRDAKKDDTSKRSTASDDDDTTSTPSSDNDSDTHGDGGDFGGGGASGDW